MTWSSVVSTLWSIKFRLRFFLLHAAEINNDQLQVGLRTLRIAQPFAWQSAYGRKGQKKSNVNSNKCRRKVMQCFNTWKMLVVSKYKDFQEITYTIRRTKSCHSHPYNYIFAVLFSRPLRKKEQIFFFLQILKCILCIVSFREFDTIGNSILIGLQVKFRKVLILKF